MPSFTSPISQKTFFKGDKVQLKWNAQGTSLIVLAQTDVDKSNKSYYGETTMYLLSSNGSFDARVSLNKEGPIHDVAWSPNGREFGVIYGFMPAKTTIFNHRAVEQHSFPIGPRNTIIFSPTGRFVLVAGFGNLAGQIDVYDLEKDYRKVTTIESGNPSVCTWSPDSRYIMTATTSPRLRVDNGIRLWHVGGGIMYNEDFVELYHATWRPARPDDLPGGDPLHPVPTPHKSALAYLGTVKTPSKPVGAYRPPGARGTSTPLHFRREDEGGAAHVASNGTPSIGPNGFGRPRRQIPGAEFAEPAPSVPGATPADGDEGLSKAAAKNKKKRGKKNKDGAAANGDGEPQAQGGASLAPPAREFGHSSGNEGRSPDRRGQHSNHHRSQSRNNMQGPGGRNRSNTHRRDHSRPAQGSGDARNHGQQHPHPHQHQHQQPQQQQQQQQVQPPTGPIADQQGGAPLSPANDANNPNAKKMRSLQKKIRAIEDLEMRLAGGEKLEDTQMKKMATKHQVMKELEALERAS